MRSTEAAEQPKANAPAAGADQRDRAQTIPLSAGASRRPGGVYGVLIASIFLLFWSMTQIAALNDSPVTDTFWVSIAALLWLIIYGIGTVASFGSPYLFTSAFVLAFVVFHFGLIAQDGFGLVNVASYRGPFGKWATLAGWYANLALGALGVGFAAASVAKGRGKAVTRKIAQRTAELNLARLRNLSIGLWFACGAFLVLAIVQLGNILSYDRFTLWFGGLDTRGLGLFNWIAPSATLGLVITARTPRQRRWSYAVAFIALVIFVLSGNRSMALFPLLVGCVLWVKSGHRIPVYVAPIFVAIVLVIIPLIGSLRTMGTYEELSAKDIASAAEGGTISGAFAELGSSSGVLALALEYIPAEEPYRYGRTYLVALSNILPNLTSKTDASEDPRGALAAGGSVEEVMSRLTPSRWASVKAYGFGPAIYGNYGTGFSAVAEPYMNFGFVGVVVYFLVLGALMGRMDRSNLLLEYPWLVFGSFLYWPFVLTVRNEFGNFTKPVSFILICLGIWWLVRRFTPFART